MKKQFLQENIFLREAFCQLLAVRILFSCFQRGCL